MVIPERFFSTYHFRMDSNKIHLSCLLFIMHSLMFQYKQFPVYCGENHHFKSIQSDPFRLICSCVGVLAKCSTKQRLKCGYYLKKTPISHNKTLILEESGSNSVQGHGQCSGQFHLKNPVPERLRLLLILFCFYKSLLNTFNLFK